MDSCLMKTKCIVTYCLHRPSNNNNTTIITLTTTTTIITIAFSDGDNFGLSHNKWTVLVKISLGVILVKIGPPQQVWLQMSRRTYFGSQKQFERMSFGGKNKTKKSPSLAFEL